MVKLDLYCYQASLDSVLPSGTPHPTGFRRYFWRPMASRQRKGCLLDYSACRLKLYLCKRTLSSCLIVRLGGLGEVLVAKEEEMVVLYERAVDLERSRAIQRV